MPADRTARPGPRRAPAAPNGARLPVMCLLALFCLAALLVASNAAAAPDGTSARDECPQDHRLKKMPGPRIKTGKPAGVNQWSRHEWTGAEKWAWNKRLCVGRNEVDFSEYKEANGKCRSTEVSSAFIRRLLTYEPMKDVLNSHEINSITLKCAVTKDELDLQRAQFEKEIKFSNFEFEGRILLKNSSFGNLVIENSTISRSVAGRGAKVSENVTIRNTAIKGNVSFEGSEISGKLNIYCKELKNFDNSLSFSKAYIREIGIGFCKFNSIYGFGAEVSEFSILGTTALNDLDLRDLNVHKKFEIYASSMKKIDLRGSVIGGDIDFKNCHIGNPEDEEKIRYKRKIQDVVVLNLVTAKTNSIFISSCKIYGTVNAVNTTTGLIYLKDTKIVGFFNMIDGQVNGYMFFKDFGVTKKFNLQGTKINGYIVFKACEIGSNGTLHRRELDDPDPVLAIRFGTMSVNLEINECKIFGRSLILATTIEGYLHFQNSIVDGNVGIYNTEIGEEMSILYYGRMGAQRKFDAHNLRIGGDVKISAKSILPTSIIDSTIGGKLTLECQRDNSNWKLFLSGTQFRELELHDCLYDDRRPAFYSDFHRWEYDGNAIEKLVDSENLYDRFRKLVLQEQDTHIPRPYIHIPRPYIQLANALAELGRMEWANEVRILERERNLANLKGVEGAWQWIMWHTTEFGYRPVLALGWLVVLIVIGTVFILISIYKPGQTERRRKCSIILAFFLLIALSVVLVFQNVQPFLSVDYAGFCSIVLIVIISVLASYAGQGIGLKDAETADKPAELDASAGGGNESRKFWPTARSALLYSLDRAIPFLAFDSEHVKWFKEKHHLNDGLIPCLYFYLHSILGFTLISLFIAGLTGILK